MADEPGGHREVIDTNWLDRLREGLAGRTPTMPKKSLLQRMAGTPSASPLNRGGVSKMFDRALRRFGYVHMANTPMPEYTISHYTPERRGEPSRITIEGTLRGGQRVQGDLHRI